MLNFLAHDKRSSLFRMSVNFHEKGFVKVVRVGKKSFFLLFLFARIALPKMFFMTSQSSFIVLLTK